MGDQHFLLIFNNQKKQKQEIIHPHLQREILDLKDLPRMGRGLRKEQHTFHQRQHLSMAVIKNLKDIDDDPVDTRAGIGLPRTKLRGEINHTNHIHILRIQRQIFRISKRLKRQQQPQQT